VNFDFATVMVLAVLVTGVIWLLDIFLWKPKRLASADTMKQEGVEQKVIDNTLREPTMVEYARSFFPVILVVLVLRSFLVEPFRIPSGSMMPTLLSGDFILVNKFSYGIRLPVIDTKIIQLDEPHRGDVVVFRYPKDPSVDYIKRVVGLPGDTISYFGKQVYVNGELAKQTLIGPYTATGEGLAMTVMGSDLRQEQLGKVKHEILIVRGRPSIEGEFVVPEGKYFVMGDNRDNSNDSRFWGFVPEKNLVGKAFMIWMNWDGIQKRVSWERIGNMIN
jgi:signal peptidase I